MVLFRPMTPEELRRFLERSIPEYARDNVRAGRWSDDQALELSRKEHENLLPNGLATPDHFLRTVVDRKDGTSVGETWYALQRQGARPQLFVYWVGIAPEHRRHGYASQVFGLIEGEARRLGAGRVSLHVFAENTGARALYERLGFQPTNLILSKPVSTT